MAGSLALAVVRQDLEEEPGIFNQSFLEGHIDTDKLRRELRYDVWEITNEDVNDWARHPDLFWGQAASYIDVPEEDDDGELPEPTEEDAEQISLDLSPRLGAQSVAEAERSVQAMDLDEVIDGLLDRGRDSTAGLSEIA